jgi:rare lipoprotein A
MPCLTSFSHGSALIAGRLRVGGRNRGCNMSIDYAKSSYVASSYVAIETNHIPDASAVSAARVRNIFQSLVIVLGAASLAACAQSSAVRNSGFASPSRYASVNHDRTASFFTVRHVATARKHTPFARPNNATPTQIASQGVASFYTEGQQTASGEKFDTHDLTAAHPTLPFGTRLRVTNVSTGRSVTVRVNDRGPYVPGRVVDVSHSAANALGMVESGIAKVKLDVVQ